MTKNTLIRMESLNEEVMSGLGSPLVKVARESTSNDLTKSCGAMKVAPSAKVGGSPIVCLIKSYSSVLNLSLLSSILSVSTATFPLEHKNGLCHNGGLVL
jgi:hypothetical protein